MKTIEGGGKEADWIITDDDLGEVMAKIFNAPLEMYGLKPKFAWDKNNKKIVEIKLVSMEGE